LKLLLADNCAGLAHLGVTLDAQRNLQGDANIVSEPASRCAVQVLRDRRGARHRAPQERGTHRMNPLAELVTHGQSVWLDALDRGLIEGGTLERLIEADGVTGVTSNPAIFEKAIANDAGYDALLAEWAREHLAPAALFERLAIGDIRDAADLLAPVYAATQARDGYVSLEVAPRLARDPMGTVEDARRLWHTVQRPNLMIKVPGTPQCMPAVEQLIADGINVNVTLLFARQAYRAFASAYCAGLERRSERGERIDTVRSVASFFVSRIDTEVDRLLDARGAPSTLKGLAAVANARLAYEEFQASLSQPRWHALVDRGASPQRLLWASTGTKDPAYRDVVYVEELIGPDTVTTLPLATLDAFRDHGRVRASLREALDAAREHESRLAQCDVDLGDVTERLLIDGIRLFAEAHELLLQAIAARTRS